MALIHAFDLSREVLEVANREAVFGSLFRLGLS